MGWRIRLYPSARQRALLARCIEAQRRLWNDMLEAMIKEQDTMGKFLGRAEREQFVKRWKLGPQGEGVPANALYRVARDMGQAISRWQRRRQQMKPGGFPNFRSRHGRQSGIYQAGKSTHVEPRRVWLAKVGWVRWRGGKLPRGRLVSGRVWLDAGERWMLGLVYDCPPHPPKPATTEKVAVLTGGDDALATVFDGNTTSTVPDPVGDTSRAQRRLARLSDMIDRTTMNCPSCAATLSRRAWKAAGRQKEDTAPCGHPLAAYEPSRRYWRLNQRRGVVYRKRRLQRRDASHKASSAVAKQAKQIHLASHADGPTNELFRLMRYKADWHRRALVVAPMDAELTSVQKLFELDGGGEDRPPGAG